MFAPLAKRKHFFAEPSLPFNFLPQNQTWGKRNPETPAPNLPNGGAEQMKASGQTPQAGKSALLQPQSGTSKQDSKAATQSKTPKEHPKGRPQGRTPSSTHRGISKQNPKARPQSSIQRCTLKQHPRSRTPSNTPKQNLKAGLQTAFQSRTRPRRQQ